MHVDQVQHLVPNLLPNANLQLFSPDKPKEEQHLLLVGFKTSVHPGRCLKKFAKSIECEKLTEVTAFHYCIVIQLRYNHLTPAELCSTCTVHHFPAAFTYWGISLYVMFVSCYLRVCCDEKTWKL